ncbi:MAG TPA: Ig-like domain-containing protein [Gemmatimonadaceae bacterium]|nr:Ig-like domain-containing protein [Gemmatimonadaceae bacterium]
MRQLILLVAVVGCAQLGAPPGGPEDKNPPHLMRISPDTNALNVRPRSIEMRFDEVVNERPATGGQDLANLFLLSPRRGRVDVRWHRSRLEIRPRRGWVPNTTYTLTQLRGVADLRGNADTTQHRYEFTTGPTRPPSAIRGQVFDWVGNRAAPRAYVEAIQLPDSLVYSDYADSLGRFAIQHVAPGRYLVRALLDENTNRVIDRRELFDSATVTVGDSTRRELLAFIHDSAGPGITTVDVVDSLTIRTTFDRPLTPRVQVAASQFSLRAADSAVVPIASVAVGSVYEKQQQDSARAKAVRDSTRQAQIADSIRRANPQAAPPRAAVPPAPPPRRPPAGPARDTTPPPRPSAPIPETFAVIRLTRPLATATSYRVRADSLRSLLGIVRSSDRVFTTPRTRTQPDSTRARPDSARRPPGPPVRRPPDRERPR